MEISKNILHYSESLSKLEDWIYSYACQPGSGTKGIGGPVATIWASSFTKTGPYLMNSYGLLRGLCSHSGSYNFDMAINRARELVQYFIECQDPASGIFYSGWGEDKMISTALVQQASVICALTDFYIIEPEPIVREAIDAGWAACLKNSIIKNSWQVANQALRGIEALLLIGKFRDLKNDELSFIKKTIKKIIDNQKLIGLGGIPQSKSSDWLILPYQGKCIAPLVMAGTILGDYEILECAKRVADFCLESLDETSLKLIPSFHIPKYKYDNSFLKFKRFGYIPSQVFKRVNQIRQKSINNWIRKPYPLWIARSADTARGLIRLGNITNMEKYTMEGFNLVDRILGFQNIIGGIQNTIGYKGEGSISWQDVLPNPRWNSYVIQLLHEILSTAPVSEIKEIDENMVQKAQLDNGLLIENKSEVIFISNNELPNWKITKGKKWGVNSSLPKYWDDFSPIQGSIN